MEKKVFHRRHLPHFQHPGQSYFVTWCLKDAVPAKALVSYTNRLKQIMSQIEIAKSTKMDVEILSGLKTEYLLVRKKYIKAYDDLLHIQTEYIVDLSKKANTEIILSALSFWEGKRIENRAICVMNNHVHWVFKTLVKGENAQPVYLQDILQSVKRFSANRINAIENRKGSLWHNESFDTTIRDDLHLQRAINYTIQNPVSAGLVKNWWEWKGTKLWEDR